MRSWTQGLFLLGLAAWTARALEIQLVGLDAIHLAVERNKADTR